ncbi:LysE/ArgO family amino acid transporter [Undibacterium squillarum]|uniref:Amino acid transporter LysE n=1 Tax=Undibacterium squillarum TaxID=1131567 RepID=A0ABQ2XRV6_9BURK|nr:LysE/ArgO family amino acid transporter [Undibacterium squillarum]GGX30661.1 amino acid transporter LysE [Undibacterium squillarum]
MMLAAFFQGLMVCLSLIVAIGAQNIFVLRQGLRRESIWPVVIFCAATDAVLISSGVLGLSQTLKASPLLNQLLAAGGACFLIIYGWQALQRVRRGQQMAVAAATGTATTAAILAQAAAFTVLNPHVYLDTVLLMGGIGAQQPPDLRWWFIAGASAASLGWFSLIGFGAGRLAPLFAHPRAWQIVDALIVVTMWSMALMLLTQGV